MSSNHILREVSMRRRIAAAGLFASLCISGGTAIADNLVDPPVFASQNGVLDIMMVAMPQPIAGISFTPPNNHATIHPTGWVYQVCPRPPSGLSCPSNSRTVAPYGGVRLAMQPGDTLKIRYVNRLPKLDPLKLRHVTDPGEANLFLNPSNLHTHGLITPARTPTVSDPTFGDFVFVTVFNS
ncbi:MAG: multicopper oxidase domain-containing protein, partial [Xanthobacteraceae bacterium]